jgi:hypothetical protein
MTEGGPRVRKLAVLGIAIVGLVALLSSLSYVASPAQLFVLGALGSTPGVIALAITITPVLVSIAGGLYLLLRRETIADAWFREADESAVVAAEDMVRAGMILIGVYLLVQAVPTLINGVGRAVFSVTQAGQELAQGAMTLGSSDVRVILLESAPGILASLASLGLGWLLVARSRQLTRRLIGSDPVQRSLAACPSCGTLYDPSEYEGGLSAARCPTCKQELALPRA